MASAGETATWGASRLTALESATAESPLNAQVRCGDQGQVVLCEWLAVPRTARLLAGTAGLQAGTTWLESLSPRDAAEL